MVYDDTRRYDDMRECCFVVRVRCWQGRLVGWVGRVVDRVCYLLVSVDRIRYRMVSVDRTDNVWLVAPF